MKARVLYLNDTHNVPGGAEYQVTQLAQAVRQAGGEALVACIPGSQTEADFQGAGIKTVPVSSLRTNPLAAGKAVKRICGDLSIDIIHTASFLTNYAGRRAGRALKLPVVTTVHCEPDSIILARPGPTTRIESLVRSLFDRRQETSAFIAVSNAVAEKLIAQGVPRQKVTVIANGVNREAIRRAAAAGSAPVGRMTEDQLLVGVMARLDAVKGLDVLIKAVAVLAGGGLKVKAVIIGQGEERPALDKLVADLGVGANIVFTGHLSNPYAQLAALDIYAVSSHSEGQNQTVLVAMALGLPVVATAVGGIVDMIEDGQTGLLVPPRDPQALAKAMAGLAGDERLRKRLTKESERVLDRFTVGRMCEQTLDVYRRLIRQG